MINLNITLSNLLAIFEGEIIIVAKATETEMKN